MFVKLQTCAMRLIMMTIIICNAHTLTHTLLTTDSSIQNGGEVLPTMYIQRMNSSSPSDWNLLKHNYTFNNNTFQNKNNNCTNRENPCRSIFEAVNAVWHLYDHHEISRMAARFILLSSSDGNCYYGGEQCQFNYKDSMLEELIIQSENDQNIITLDCEHHLLFEELQITTLTFYNIHLERIGFKTLSMTRNDNFRTQVSESNHYVSSNNGHTIFMIDTRVRNSTFNFLNSVTSKFNRSIFETTNIVHHDKSSFHFSNSDFHDFQVESRSQYVKPVLRNDFSFVIEECKFSHSKLVIHEFFWITLKNVIFYDDNYLDFLFSDNAALNYITAIGKFHLRFKGIPSIVITQSQFERLEKHFLQPHSPSIQVITASVLEMYHTLFLNCRTSLINVQDVQKVYAINMTFYNNVGETCIKAHLGDFMGGTTFQLLQSTISNNTFSTQNALDSVAAVLDVSADQVVMYESEFSGNRASYSIVNILSALELFIDRSTFENNTAELYGGALSVNSLQTIFHNSSCLDNRAMTGGCLFFQNPDQVQHLQMNHVVMKGNIGESFGTNVAYPFSNVKSQLVIYYTSENVTILKADAYHIPELFLYPGQTIETMELFLWNNGTIRVNFLSYPIKCNWNERKDAYLSYRNNHTTSLNSFAISLFNASIQLIHVKMLLDFDYELPLLIHVMPCPEGTELSMHGLPSGSLICTAFPQPPLAIIVPLVIIASFVFFLTATVLIYFVARVGRNIFQKLKRLERKESAEKKMESKLIEKRIVLMNEEKDQNDECSSVNYIMANEKTSLLRNSTQRLISINKDIEVRQSSNSSSFVKNYLGLFQLMILKLRGESERDQVEQFIWPCGMAHMWHLNH
nr:unnamed protein product [Naegleria fowleri]